MTKKLFFAGLMLGLLFWSLSAPRALAAGVCNCTGDVSINLAGKGMKALAEKALEKSIDVASLCNSYGGKFEGSWYKDSCSGLKGPMPASSKSECEGYTQDILMEKFSVPFIVSAGGSATFKCIWEASADLSPDKNATGTTAGGGAGVGVGSPAAPAGGCPKDAVCIENPIAGSTDMLGVYGNIVKYALGLVGSLTLLMLVWGGFQWVTSAGNAEKVNKGSQTMIWAAIGAFLVLASYLIMTTFLEFLVGKP